MKDPDIYRKKELILISGLPGSGKSTLATRIANAESSVVFEADMYFYHEGKYIFEPRDLPTAHAWCQMRTRGALEAAAGAATVVVANTFSRKWETEAYYKIAKSCQARVVLIDLFDQGCSDEQLAARNTHGVPQAAIAAMRARWEHGQSKVWDE